MIEGTVSGQRVQGFGFLSHEGGPDVFVHHSEIRAEGFRTLNEGDQGPFRDHGRPEGPRASNVTLAANSANRTSESRGRKGPAFVFLLPLGRALESAAEVGQDPGVNGRAP